MLCPCSDTATPNSRRAQHMNPDERVFHSTDGGAKRHGSLSRIPEHVQTTDESSAHLLFDFLHNVLERNVPLKKVMQMLIHKRIHNDNFSGFKQRHIEKIQVFLMLFTATLTKTTKSNSATSKISMNTLGEPSTMIPIKRLTAIELKTSHDAIRPI